jgi:hypothetical protein
LPPHVSLIVGGIIGVCGSQLENEITPDASLFLEHPVRPTTLNVNMAQMDTTLIIFLFMGTPLFLWIIADIYGPYCSSVDRTVVFS